MARSPSRAYLPVIDGDVARVPLSQGLTAVIDADDAEMVSEYVWSAFLNPHTRGYYAVSHSKLANGRRPRLRMHRLIMKAPTDRVVDHRDHDGLNNRRSNLRICTHTENTRNLRGPQRNGTSGYIGVTWNKQVKRWRAQTKIDSTQHHVGHFNTAIEAALARDAYIRERFPDDEFWYFNFPSEGDR